ncbi:hypothetical protein IFM89_036317, partial [Coptis chinensis]
LKKKPCERKKESNGEHKEWWKGRGRGGGGGEEPLHAAAREGDLGKVQLICSSNPLAVNSRDKHSRTPLPINSVLHFSELLDDMVICVCGLAVFIVHFLDKKDLNSSLHLAAWSGRTEVVSYLCKNKADVGAAAMDDMGAIHFAAQKGHLEVVRTLLSSGVSVKAPNRKGLTALHYAVQGSYLDLVKYLVRKGASLTTKTKAGKTPLDLANKEEVISFLNECQTSRPDEDSTVKANSGEPDSKPDKAANSTDEAVSKDMEEQEEVSKDEKLKSRNEDQDIVGEESKRKGDEDVTDGNSPKPKKARVALNHLLAADDTQEEN